MQANRPSESDQCRPGIIHLKFHVGGKIGESRVHAIGGQDEVDHVVGAALSHSEGHLIIRHGQFFVRHPAGDFDDLVDIGANIAGVLDYGMKAIQHRAANELGPAHA